MSKYVVRNVVGAQAKDGRWINFDRPLSVWEALKRVADESRKPD